MDTAGSTTTTSTLGYDVASELTSLLVKQGSATTKSLTLSYNRDGDRTGQTDSVGGGTVGYGYDQADRLTTYSRGGSQWTYGYDGDGLRQTKTITSTVEPYTYYLAEALPLIVQDGATRYLTGPGGLPVEQVDGSGNVLYYRQDQVAAPARWWTARGRSRASTPTARRRRSAARRRRLATRGQYTDARCAHTSLSSGHGARPRSACARTLDAEVMHARHRACPGPAGGGGRTGLAR